MIKLSDVSAIEALYYQDKYLLKTIMKHNLYSMEDLMNYINTHREYGYQELQNRMNEAIRIIEENNKKGYEPETYEYENKGIELVDKANKGRVLLLDNPTIEFQQTFYFVKTYSIDTIKRNLKLTDKFGRNIMGLAPSSMNTLLKALQMYDEQVLRQEALIEKRNYNIFMKYKKAKREIVKGLYLDIIMYLIDNTNERTIWGELTEEQKRLYISSTINSKQTDEMIRNRMINIISNYTTLPELETLATGNRSILKRFIEK